MTRGSSQISHVDDKLYYCLTFCPSNAPFLKMLVWIYSCTENPFNLRLKLKADLRCFIAARSYNKMVIMQHRHFFEFSHIYKED